VAVNSIYASIIPSYKYNLVLKSFSYGTQVMGHPVHITTENSIVHTHTLHGCGYSNVKQEHFLLCQNEFTQKLTSSLFLKILF
jgi:hypothetical protein